MKNYTKVTMARAIDLLMENEVLIPWCNSFGNAMQLKFPFS